MPQPSFGNMVPPKSFNDRVLRWLRDHDQRITELATARSGQAMQIGKGGIDIVGGALRLLDLITKAVLIVLDSAGIHINNGGVLELNDGSSAYINDGGNLYLRTPSNLYVVHFGKYPIPDGSGRTQQIAAIGRDDGTTAFSVADIGIVPGHTHRQNWALWDRSDNIIIAEDTDSGEGLAYPYIDAGWIDVSVPLMSTNSGSFTQLQWSYICKTHPRIGAAILAYTPAGTAGELRITWGGVQIGSPVSVPSNTFTIVGIDPAPWPSGVAHRQEGALVLEGRVISGAGSIYARGMNNRQRGS